MWSLLLAAAVSVSASTQLPDAPAVYFARADLTDPSSLKAGLLRDGRTVFSVNVAIACRVALLGNAPFLAYDPGTGDCRGVTTTPVPVDGALAIVEPPPLIPVSVAPAVEPALFADGFEG